MRRLGLLLTIAGLLLATGPALAQYGGSIPGGSTSTGTRDALSSPSGGWNVGEFDCATGIGGEVAGLPTLTLIAAPETECGGRNLRIMVKVLGDGLTDAPHTYQLDVVCNDNLGTIEAAFALDGQEPRDITTGTFTFADINLITSEFTTQVQSGQSAASVPSLSTWGLIFAGLLLAGAAIWLIVLRS